MLLSETKVFGGSLKNKESLFNSSSGGAFTALSDVFLDRKDAIVCSVYNYETHKQEYKLITSEIERNKARGSKYVQAFPEDIFAQAENWLYNNPEHKILFVGMGCQASGFRSYAEMRGFLNRITIIDIICHGSPSPKVWLDYISFLEDKRGKISFLSFKDKRKGWMNPTAFAKIQTKEVSLKPYLKIYYSNNILRPSCHKCPYTKVERTSDITIGDFWNLKERVPSKYNEKGVSLFIVHTTEGLQLFEQAKGSLEWFESTTTECWQYNLENPTKVAANRETFWHEYETKGIKYIIKKYGNESLIKRIKKFIGRIIKK